MSQTKKLTFMDYQAGNPVDPVVMESMKPYWADYFGNPGTLHTFGKYPKDAIEEARTKIADLIGANRKEEIVFTGGATESNNLAIKGAAFRNKEKGTHIITSSVEHMSVLNPIKSLVKFGFKNSSLPTDRYGVVDLDALKKEITNETILVSVMLANGEIGTVQPIKEISAILREKSATGKKIFFHMDATAACGQLPINVQDLGADLVTLSSNDMYG
ncbi:MAG: cysteine desulfurase family protein, partial [Candidatus Bathyarchaeia archaeon]